MAVPLPCIELVVLLRLLPVDVILALREENDDDEVEDVDDERECVYAGRVMSGARTQGSPMKRMGPQWRQGRWKTCSVAHIVMVVLVEETLGMIATFLRCWYGLSGGEGSWFEPIVGDRRAGGSRPA